jgi:Inovirus Coat protein B
MSADLVDALASVLAVGALSLAVAVGIKLWEWVLRALGE